MDNKVNNGKFPKIMVVFWIPNVSTAICSFCEPISNPMTQLDGVNVV